MQGREQEPSWDAVRLRASVVVWNYAFWNGKANFAKKMAVGTKNVVLCLVFVCDCDTLVIASPFESVNLNGGLMTVRASSAHGMEKINVNGKPSFPLLFLSRKAFLELLSSHNFQGTDVDAIVLPLVPMFHTGTYNLPFRILKEKELIQLSGLQDFWNNVSLTGPRNVAPKYVW